MKKRLFAFTLMGALSLAAPLSAQANDTPAKPAPSQKQPVPADKPKMDLDGFFKDAEKQTRKAQENGNSNCVPKPKDRTPKDPIS